MGLGTGSATATRVVGRASGRVRRMQEHRVALAAPVPVGHHVSLRTLERAVWDDSGSVVGHEPCDDVLVRDDETGIVYAPSRLVAWVDPQPLVLRPPGGGFRSTETLVRGKVLLCVVGTSTGPPITRLWIEPSAPVGPFR